MGCLKLSYHSATEEPLYPSALRVIHSSDREKSVWLEPLFEEKIIPLYLHVEPKKNDQNIGVNGYVLNNPLKYTDPSGEVFWLVPVIVAAVKAAAIGAAIGATGYTASVAFSQGGFNNWNPGQFWKSVGIGAVSGVVTAGIGSYFGHATGSFWNEVGRAATHGFANGAISDLTGGSFASGFLAGGVGAELSGGDFWRGAATGATVAGLNHMGNKVLGGGKPKPKTQTAEEVAGGLGIYAGTKEAILELAEKTGDLGKAGEYTLKATKWLGRASGITQVGTSGYELYDNYQNHRPIAGSAVKFGVSVLSLRVNPTVGVVMGLADAFGGTQWIYNKINTYAK